MVLSVVVVVGALLVVVVVARVVVVGACVVVVVVVIGAHVVVGPRVVVDNVVLTEDRVGGFSVLGGIVVVRGLRVRLVAGTVDVRPSGKGLAVNRSGPTVKIKILRTITWIQCTRNEASFQHTVECTGYLFVTLYTGFCPFRFFSTQAVFCVTMQCWFFFTALIYFFSN